MADEAEKEEFPPLLEPGLRPHTLDAIESLCVTAFPKSVRRPQIMALFREVVAKLEAAAIVCDLWVDGSFLTTKDEPDDVDIVLRVESAFSDACTEEQTAALLWFAGNLKVSHSCHSFVIVKYPESDSRYWRGEYAYAYWLRQWGFSRSDILKGVALVQLPRGNV